MNAEIDELLDEGITRCRDAADAGRDSGELSHE